MSSREPTRFVHGVVDSFGFDNREFYMVPEAELEELEEIAALLKCSTWGEIRSKATPTRYAELLALSGFGDFADFAQHLWIGTPVPGAFEEALRAFATRQEGGLPHDSTPFRTDDLPSYSDGDYPPDLRLLQFLHLPEEALTQYAEVYDTTFNGRFADLDPDRVDEVVAIVESLGHTSSEDSDRFARLWW